MGQLSMYDTYGQPGLDSMRLDYNGSMPQPTVSDPYSRAGNGLEAAGGATATVLPWVGAGLSAAGLLSNLYGGYKSQQMAEKNYRAQMEEYKRQQQLAAEATQRQIAQQQLQNQYTAKDAVDADASRRLAQYSGYFRGVGL